MVLGYGHQIYNYGTLTISDNSHINEGIINEENATLTVLSGVIETASTTTFGQATYGILNKTNANLYFKGGEIGLGCTRFA